VAVGVGEKFQLKIEPLGNRGEQGFELRHLFANAG
jgi:hypothetical protein